MKPNQSNVMMVDDEPNVLSAYRRTLGRTYDLTTAEGGAAGLANLVKEKPFAVIVSDMRMPGMTGLEFILAAREKCKDTVFMMLTGNADQQTAVDAINTGQIFRFLNKPCPPELLDAAIKAGIRQYDLATAERVLLRDTVSGSVKLVMEALEVACPLAFGYQTSVKAIQQQVCANLGPCVDWQIGMAVLVCMIGLVASPANEQVTDEMLASSAEIGGKLLSHIPRLATVARMVRRQRETGTLPDNISVATPERIEQVGARVLRFAVDLARMERTTGSRTTAVNLLAEARQYDVRLIAAVKAAANQPGPKSVSAAGSVGPQKIATETATAGMLLNADIVRVDGLLMLNKGQVLSEIAATSLRNFVKLGMVAATIEIIAPLPAPARAAA